MSIRRFVLMALPIAATMALTACGTPQAAEQLPTPTPIARPTPTTESVVNSLKTQLAIDEVVVREITVDNGALPTLDINYEANITKLPPAGKQTASDLSAEIERSILIISKRVATQFESGFAVDRVNLVLKLQDQVVGNTRIGARDIVAWKNGSITDGEYRSRWAQTVNQ